MNPEGSGEDSLRSRRGRSARESYEAIAPVYDEFTASHDRELWIGNLLAGLEKVGLHGNRLLDVGCGTGESLLPMRKRGWQVTGCDISPAMIERARGKIDDSVRLEVADMRQLPVFGEFDLVWALGDAVNYLLSVEELTQALRGMRENLAPRGLLAMDANTLFAFRTFFAETTVVEKDGRRLIWSGQATPDAAPEQVYEARFEGEDVEELEPHVHRQRHFPERQILEVLADAGLECRTVFGYGADVGLAQPLNEGAHMRGFYVATADLSGGGSPPA